VRLNSRIILIHEGAVALMWCRDHGEEFHCFPGGGVEKGETLEDAARREAYEELGVRVTLGRCVATFTHRNGAGIGFFYEARAISGIFGTGTGPEYTPGVYPGVEVRPCWIPLDELASHSVRPWQIAQALSERRLLPGKDTLTFADEPE
jgi:8-oxo-dGTP diphosphatase